ncbi:bifunctional transcriptional activator/DNA repair enzyme AdaA [Paenibacillus sp.]|jgi:AraC family transcriptional regulator of adaptative response / methylphosphotriester-DNA alkyltransferase methyltransferase|uniref:bifunctional transcriptional activator/DNA repair enzyme AdaA n=1 Tax=Paenibacillus sp. TaxID=58172 RepID=UPI0028252D99|nr:bifunctional transcriptional activator/DNA repair enzyme AdaA [Paenibacillus sp.]MDR0271483.1 bifunctional transcriptional activator/DNA repair enzyme AdaA [Paenibacillus sp.]
MRDKYESAPLTEEKWKAIIGNDKSYDFKFFYAVKSTGIFCRPSCKSKAPNRENVRIFMSAEQAQREEFRPCKRCKPTGERLPDHEWVEVMTRYMDRNFTEPINLGLLGEICHGSPYHLHRTFKKIMNITPVEYLQRLRLDHAKDLLTQSDLPVAAIGKQVGLPNTSYLISLFKRRFGYTPSEYRKRTLQN